MAHRTESTATTGDPRAGNGAVQVEIRGAEPETVGELKADGEGQTPEPQAVVEDAAAAPAPGTTAEPDDALARERDDLRDRLLRTAAEFDNYRKRVERERREQAEWAAADLLRALLPIVDDIERALAADTVSDPDAVRKGVELIHRQLLDLLARRGVTPIEPVGADFDPRFHEAMLHEASEAHRPGEVMAEFRRGYKLRDRLLRASMVKVARA